MEEESKKVELISGNKNTGHLDGQELVSGMTKNT